MLEHNAGSISQTMGDIATAGPDVAKGVGKGIANVGIGINNLMAAYKVAGAKYVAPYEGDNKTQQAALVATEDITLFAGLIGGRAQVGGLLLRKRRQPRQQAQKQAMQLRKHHVHKQQLKWLKV
jgi:hypothetical protein